MFLLSVFKLTKIRSQASYEHVFWFLNLDLSKKTATNVNTFKTIANKYEHVNTRLNQLIQNKKVRIRNMFLFLFLITPHKERKKNMYVVK